MTYDEYRNSKEVSPKRNYIRSFFSKLFTIVIFTMLIVIISNLSSDFRNFIIDNVLNNTLDFSKFNKVINNTTNIFKSDESLQVSSIVKTNKSEEYLDGIKYFVGENEKVLVKDSGIVTFIGNKKGYNNTIVIQQSNGYYAWYGNVKESVKLYDFVEAGSEIGISSDEYYYVLLKNDKPVKNED